ncbi:IS66 family insertion sequence element accessory protein TnpB [Pseudomonas shahriarae]|uniref:IS66 family insertion sequence element accessory protein TnpB n=1 Tax=unclassified Pseudomonas TaxID=196821 RepID=UPI00346352E1
MPVPRPRWLELSRCSVRRLNQDKFHWPGIRHGSDVELDKEQLQALILGLPWQRIAAGGSITVL